MALTGRVGATGVCANRPRGPGHAPGKCVPPPVCLRQEGMAMSIVEAARQITGGVDTHADLHVAAVVDHLGGVLDIATFETTEAGYGRLVGWLRHHGHITKVGVEGTGSYG